jgi:hypothetical protein
MKVKISFKWPYFHKRAFSYHLHLKLGCISMPQVNIYCVGNHFATFCWTLGFLKFLTFSLWSFHKYKISLDDGILGLIIKVMKGGISSN